MCKDDVRLQDKEILVFVKLIRVTLPEKWPFVGVQILSLLWKQFLGAVKKVMRGGFKTSTMPSIVKVWYLLVLVP